MAKYRRGHNNKAARKDREYGFFWYSWIWRVLRPVMVLCISITIVFGLMLSLWNHVNSTYIMPVDTADDAPILFEIDSGSSLSRISRKLEAEGLVRNATVFRYLCDFQGMSGKIKAGAYQLSRNMTLNDIAAKLSSSEAPIQRTITVIPGWTIENIAANLVTQGAFEDSAEFLELCNKTDIFGEYYAVNEMLDSTSGEQRDARRYKLEGYLAPDTYYVYLSESPEGIIKRLLAQSETVISSVYDTARQLYSVGQIDENGDVIINTPGVELSLDEIYILASMIELEGKTADFAKVSAVFHNRLEQDMRMDSDVTVQYAFGINRMALTDSDISGDSPYNTYVNKGLPIGPVCNPSKAALTAAMMPDEEYLDAGYLYFCSKDPESGELQFSKTLEEHTAAVEQYRPLWQAYDAAQAAAAAATQAPAE